MKIKLYTLIGALLLLMACSKEEDAMIVPRSVQFVKADGARIDETNCLRENLDYGVRLSVAKVGSGSLQPTTLTLNINGQTFSLNFDNLISKIIPVTLVEGRNRVQVDNSNISTEFFIELPRLQRDFELVE